MRCTVLAAVLLGASACCFDVAPNATCVVNGYPFPYCHEVTRTQYVCLDDDAYEEDISYYETSCNGTLHEDEHCEDLGFTFHCPNGHFVRPGSPC